MIIDAHTHIGKLPNSLYTDWPLCHMKQYIEFANDLDLKKDNLEKLFSGNAKKIFKLD
jgi:predicted TIM-barrel fold metal-dependent hydrolase